MLRRILSPELNESEALENQKSYYYENHDEEELYSLLEQILSEVFVQDENDSDSICYIEGKSIYDIADELEISNRERYAQEVLDDGSPDVTDFEELLAIAEEYFLNPPQYNTDEETEATDQVTGFVQVFKGTKFDANGKLIEYWKSTNCKIIVNTGDILNPTKAIGIVGQLGFQWSEVVRIVFYGEPLKELVGSKVYGEEESKELLSLSSEYKNILLAVPDYLELSASEESIFDCIDNEFQQGIPFGITPQGRNGTGHWESTWSRLEELAEEKLEDENLRRIARRERASVARKNNYFEKYKEARFLINGLNNDLLKVGAIYKANISTLEDVVLLSQRFNERVFNQNLFLQIKALVSKSKLNTYLATDSFALMIIQKINTGEHVDIHLLKLPDLEKIFSILWSDVGIKIIPSKKEIYFQFKDRLIQLRKLRPSFPA